MNALRLTSVGDVQYCPLGAVERHAGCIEFCQGSSLAWQRSPRLALMSF
jgi:hypothetical protein